jgi:hypothetical protein
MAVRLRHSVVECGITEDEEMTFDYVPFEVVVEEDEPEMLEEVAEKVPAADHWEITGPKQRIEERGAGKSRVRTL